MQLTNNQKLRRMMKFSGLAEADVAGLLSCPLDQVKCWCVPENSPLYRDMPAEDLQTLYYKVAMLEEGSGESG